MGKIIKKVGKYEIVERIGKGGMGALYRAKHPTLKRYVILKQLTLRGGSGFIERFKREASLMIDFRDEHIVQVYDHFKEGSSYYIVMEYVDGISLDKLIQEKGYISSEASLLIFSEISKGLKYAHDKDVIHRDIKPANILISNEGEVKLVDFGIATSKEADEEGLTKTGMTLGTPSYMSPEQITDTSKVDKRADIYSMGVVLYEMITGKKPFPSGFTPETINSITKGIYIRPKKINPSIPAIFNRVIRKTMNPKIKKRFRDLQYINDILSKYTRRYREQRDINNDIKKYLSGSEIFFPATKALGKERKNFILKLIFGLVFFILLVLGGLYFYYNGYYYEYFKNKEFGSLEIRASIPSNYYKESRLIYAQARLDYLDILEESKINIYSYNLSPVRGNLLYILQNFQDRKNKKPGNVLTTNLIFLPAGNYKLDLYLENQKYCASFYLDPRVIQKQDEKRIKKKIIQMDLAKSSPKSISIIHRVYDGVTGKSIDRETEIYLYREDRKQWIDWKLYNTTKELKKYLEDYLISGKSFSFIYTAPLYYSKTVHFFAEEVIESAMIEVNLIKKPGKLIIESDMEGFEILINNQKGSYSGEKRKEFLQYGKTTKGKKEFILLEGNYLLTVKKDRKQFQNHEFKIKPDQSSRLIVSYNKDRKEINIRE